MPLNLPLRDALRAPLLSQNPVLLFEALDHVLVMSVRSSNQRHQKHSHRFLLSSPRRAFTSGLRFAKQAALTIITAARRSHRFFAWAIPYAPEPPIHGFSVHCQENIKQVNSETCDAAQQPLTPQLTPETAKAGPIDTNALPAELAEIVTVWPELPEHIKAAITTLVQAHGKGAR